MEINLLQLFSILNESLKIRIYDSNGTASTEYSVTTSIAENADGKIDFSIGAYNEADGFAVVADYEIIEAQ